jgi:hypothetical protein
MTVPLQSTNLGMYVIDDIMMDYPNTSILCSFNSLL